MHAPYRLLACASATHQNRVSRVCAQAKPSIERRLRTCVVSSAHATKNSLGWSPRPSAAKLSARRPRRVGVVARSVTQRLARLCRPIRSQKGPVPGWAHLLNSRSRPTRYSFNRSPPSENRGPPLTGLTIFTTAQEGEIRRAPLAGPGDCGQPLPLGRTLLGAGKLARARPSTQSPGRGGWQQLAAHTHERVCPLRGH